jgi:hypothetical protein
MFVEGAGSVGALGGQRDVTVTGVGKSRAARAGLGSAREPFRVVGVFAAFLFRERRPVGLEECGYDSEFPGEANRLWPTARLP